MDHLKIAVMNASFEETLRLWPDDLAVPSNLDLLQDPALLSRDVDAAIAAAAAAEVIIAPTAITGFPSVEHLRGLPRLRMLAIAASGYEQYDLQGLRAHGISTSNVVTEIAGASVAEHALTLMLASMRRWPAQFRAPGENESYRQIGGLLAGRTVGLVGYGRIGRQVGRLAHAFGAQVIAFSYTGRASFGADVLPAESKEELFQQADVVSLHLRLDDFTRGIIDAGALRRFKEGSVLVNTARRGLMDEGAVAAALEAGGLAAAGLDDMPIDKRLARAPNVIALPHIGNRTKEGMLDVARSVLSAVTQFAAGGPIESMLT